MLGPSLPTRPFPHVGGWSPDQAPSWQWLPSLFPYHLLTARAQGRVTCSSDHPHAPSASRSYSKRKPLPLVESHTALTTARRSGDIPITRVTRSNRTRSVSKAKSATQVSDRKTSNLKYDSRLVPMWSPRPLRLCVRFLWLHCAGAHAVPLTTHPRRIFCRTDSQSGNGHTQMHPQDVNGEQTLVRCPNLSS